MKKLQVIFSEEAWATIESIHRQATEGFELGSISYSDVINEVVQSSSVDIKALQSKHIDIRRYLRSHAAQKNVDIDMVIRSLNEIRGKTKKLRQQTSAEVKDE